MPKTIHVSAPDIWNAEKNEFEYPYGKDGTDIVLEHSLMSVQKWESRWHKPFLTKEKHTGEEIVDYIRCMTITQNVKDWVYENIDEKSIKEIVDYIEDTMTAIDFRKLPSKTKGSGSKPNDETVTAELIYYWMTIYNIWYDCRKWHLEQLLNLIELCSRKTEEANERASGKNNRNIGGRRTPPPKMSSEAIANRQRLNQQRLKAAAGKKP